MLSKTRIGLCLMLFLFLTLSNRSNARAAGSEQVIFSGTAGAVGFWIWCEADSENGYLGECNGAMYFYNLGITAHVTDSAPPQEGADGVYTLFVESTGKNPISCSLSNSSAPVHGPHNTVQVSCTTPNVSAQTDTAVVVVTGK